MNTTRNIPVYQPTDYFREDPFFQGLLRRHFSADELKAALPYLEGMGKLSAQTISPLAMIADRKRPEHVPYDAQGRRVDFIDYDSSYLEMARRTYGFGIVGLGQSPDFQKAGRDYGPLLKFSLGYLFSQSGSVLYCPICMTDGTLQLLKRYGSEAMKKEWIPRITSLDYESFYDGAMYLTEVQGGSDVGANTCVARQENGQWRLYGEKWFCSNIGSKTAMVLARPEGAPKGTSGLGLFLVPRDLENGERNKIMVWRIKNKLGTCEMATGEVEFQGALAYPVGDVAKGFSYMTDMLNLSRLYNSVWSVGLMRRAYLEARHYAEGREAFGKAIVKYPLVDRLVRRLGEDTEKALAFLFEGIALMDAVEKGKQRPEDEILLRLYTPILKSFTAERSIQSAHGAIEIFAGNGCVEDFPVGKLLRDAQILAVWEGTANILALDLLRVLKKTEAASILFKKIERDTGELNSEETRQSLRKRAASLKQEMEAVLEGRDGFGGELACRELSDHLALFLQDLAHARLA